MRVELIRGGGLGGFVTRTEVVGDDLPAERLEELRARVREAGLLEAPPLAPPVERHPDEIQYELTFEHAGERRTVRVGETTMSDATRGLIAWVDAAPERREQIEPPGGALP